MSESLKVTLEITYYKVGITGIVLGLLVTGLATFFAGVSARYARLAYNRSLPRQGGRGDRSSRRTRHGFHSVGPPPPATDAVAGEDPTTNDIVLLSRLLWEIGIRNANRDPVNAQAIVGRTATHLSDVFKLSATIGGTGHPASRTTAGAPLPRDRTTVVGRSHLRDMYRRPDFPPLPGPTDVLCPSVLFGSPVTPRHNLPGSGKATIPGSGIVTAPEAGHRQDSREAAGRTAGSLGNRKLRRILALNALAWATGVRGGDKRIARPDVIGIDHTWQTVYPAPNPTFFVEGELGRKLAGVRGTTRARGGHTPLLLYLWYVRNTPPSRGVPDS